MEQLGSYRTDFHEIRYMIILRKSVAKIQVSLLSDKNNGYFTRRPIHIFDHIALNSKVVEKINSYVMFNDFFRKQRSFMRQRKNVTQPDSPQMTI